MSQISTFERKSSRIESCWVVTMLGCSNEALPRKAHIANSVSLLLLRRRLPEVHLSGSRGEAGRHPRPPGALAHEDAAQLGLPGALYY